MLRVSGDHDKVVLCCKRCDKQVGLAKRMSSPPTDLDHDPPPKKCVLIDRKHPAREIRTEFSVEPVGEHPAPDRIMVFFYAEPDFGKRYV